MNVHDAAVLVNAGIGAVLLFLYMKQADRMDSLQRELSLVRANQWQLIVRLIGEEAANAGSTAPNDETWRHLGK